MAQKVGIPDYAMQPAKTTRTIEAKACYDKTEFVCMGKQQQVSFRVEEDILVPDIKPDMEDILSIKADCDINPRERSVVCGEDLVNWTGNICLQVVYKGVSGEIVPLETQLPYKHQWKNVHESEADAAFTCTVTEIEPTIVNERKLRVNVTLEVRVTYCRKGAISVLTGLSDCETGSLQVKRQPVSLNCLATVCKDEMEIVESFPRRDGVVPKAILRQDYAVTENYKQITGDKIVLNGFIHVTLLYVGFDRQSAEEKEVVCQQCQRIEFTQFIPIPRSVRGREFSSDFVELRGRDFHTDIVSPLRGEQGEEISSQKEFQCSGTVETRISLFEKCRKDIVTDAFHTEKEFAFVMQPRSFETMYSSSASEISTRDVISIMNPPVSTRNYESDLFGYCTPEDVKLSCDSGRASVEGSLLWHITYRDAEGICGTVKEEVPFHSLVELEGDVNSDNVDWRIMLKSCEADFLNDSQIEVRAQLVVILCSYIEYEIVELTEPVYIEGIHRKTYPMIITSIGPGETLWDVAKRHHIPEDSIRETENGRLLIMK